jgi:hypothetical protein
LDEGLLKLQEDRVSGLENAPAALLRLLTGSSRGKVVVQISEEYLPAMPILTADGAIYGR